MPKTNDTIIADIHKLLNTKEVPSAVDQEAVLDLMGENMKSIIRETIGKVRDNRKLRLSIVGRDERYLWMKSKYPDAEDAAITGEKRVMFLYGHLVEEMLLALVRLTDHKVTDEQKTVSVAGVTGHMDCKINGTIVDVKSASSFGFKKFRDNKLHLDDPFGYIGQNKAYAFAEGVSKYGWLAMDKVTGALAYLEYDEKDEGAPYYDSIQWNPEERIKKIKKLIASEDAPEELCALPIPDGKSGNMKLSNKCMYCVHKFRCYTDLRTFLYSTGPRYFTEIVKMPRQLEVPDEF